MRKFILNLLDISNKEKMKEQLARLGSNEAKAEAIQTRQVEVLEVVDTRIQLCI